MRSTGEEFEMFILREQFKNGSWVLYDAVANHMNKYAKHKGLFEDGRRIADKLLRRRSHFIVSTLRDDGKIFVKVREDIAYQLANYYNIKVNKKNKKIICRNR